MDILYCQSKAKQITEQIQNAEEQIKSYQSAIDQLTQKHIFLQGSLAVVNELIALEGGGSAGETG